MSTEDNLRLLRDKAHAARRSHIAQTLDQQHTPPSAARLPELQKMIHNVEVALGQAPPAGPRQG